MKKLKIAQIAPIWYPVPPKKYGGIERIVYYLVEGTKKTGARCNFVFYWKFEGFCKNSLVEKKGVGRR